jgi:hypothetical protein
VYALWVLVRSAFDEGAASITALFAAFWPSAVFFGSQYLKDPLITAAVTAGAALVLSAGPGRAGAARMIGGLIGVLTASSLRAMIIVPVVGALIVAASAAWLSERRRAILLLIFCLLLPAAHKASVHVLFERLMPFTDGVPLDAALRGEILPDFIDQNSGHSRVVPWTPRGLAAYRRYRHRQDQIWSMNQTGRRIETQIYPDYPLDDWLDLAIFLPKAALYSSFMPLPGLYPLEGKLTRLVAALENAALVVVALLFSASLIRFRFEPERAFLASFFLLCAIGAAPLEFDLGSAARHKILIFPLLIPFAVERFTKRSPDRA